MNLDGATTVILLLHLITLPSKVDLVNLFEVGDKVRLKTGPHRGARGVVEVVAGEKVSIRVPGVRHVITIYCRDVTNFSLAARKAWLRMPKRQVGRPKGSKCVDRISVTLRIDREIWKRFLTMEERGLIIDRTNTINLWLRQKLARMTPPK